MQVHRHVDGRLQAEQHGKAGCGKARERILGASGVMEAAQDDEGKQSSEQQTQHDAEFFRGDRKHEVGIVLCLLDRKSTRLNSSHLGISYAVFCLKKKKAKVRSKLI